MEGLSNVTCDLLIPNDNRKGPNCGVTAVAIAANVSFDTAWAMFRVWKTKQWMGCTHHFQRLHILEVLKVPFLELVPVRRETVEQAAQRLPDGLYMVRINRHVMMMQGGRVADQGGVIDADKSLYRRRRVLNITQIIRS